jgi:hypothetical protein
VQTAELRRAVRRRKEGGGGGGRVIKTSVPCCLSGSGS